MQRGAMRPPEDGMTQRKGAAARRPNFIMTKDVDMSVANEWNGERIRGLRTVMGWSQRELAEKLVCSYRAVQMWEADRHPPKAVYTEKMEAFERKFLKAINV